MRLHRIDHLVSLPSRPLAAFRLFGCFSFVSWILAHGCDMAGLGSTRQTSHVRAWLRNHRSSILFGGVRGKAGYPDTQGRCQVSVRGARSRAARWLVPSCPSSRSVARRIIRRKPKYPYPSTKYPSCVYSIVFFVREDPARPCPHALLTPQPSAQGPKAAALLRRCGVPPPSARLLQRRLPLLPPPLSALRDFGRPAMRQLQQPMAAPCGVDSAGRQPAAPAPQEDRRRPSLRAARSGGTLSGAGVRVTHQLFQGEDIRVHGAPSSNVACHETEQVSSNSFVGKL
jgi:hypothetical protein